MIEMMDHQKGTADFSVIICAYTEKRWSEFQAAVESAQKQTLPAWEYFFLRCYNEGLSKAVLTCRVGTQQGLSSVRNYTFSTLPQGALQGLLDTVRGDPSGLGRTAAILASLVVTTAGYVVGSIAERLTAWKKLYFPHATFKRV